MRYNRRQQTSIALALLLTLATMLAPWSIAMASPSEPVDMAQQMLTMMDSGDQHEHEAGMTMDSMAGENCCDPDDCNDCDQDCSSCTLTPAMVLNPLFNPSFSPALHFLPTANDLFSNIPPPPNKPPV